MLLCRKYIICPIQCMIIKIYVIVGNKKYYINVVEIPYNVPYNGSQKLTTRVMTYNICLHVICCVNSARIFKNKNKSSPSPGMEGPSPSLEITSSPRSPPHESEG